MHVIKLPNRNYKTLDVTEVEDGKFKVTDKKVHYIRYIYGKTGKDITAIDPEGGPFLEVGSKLDGRKIISIDKNGVMTVEEVA